MATLTRDDVQASTERPITREDVQELLQISGGPCVSLYMPTIRAGAQTQQNAIRYKNLVRSLQERLEGMELPHGAADELLDPLRGLIDDHGFWQTQSDGLAVFRSPDLFRAYRMPLELEELAVVESRLHLKPLFSLLSGDGRFYILSLSHKSIRLIEASHYSAEERELPGVPQSVTESLGENVTRQYSQFQASTSSKTVARMPLFAGHGTGEEDLKAEVRQFFNLVDKALLKIIDRNVPVVLAGVEYLLPRFKETTGHPWVLDEALTGNAEGLSPEELRAAAWEIVEPVFLEERRKAAGRYFDLLGTGRASSRFDEVLPAAHDGRVDTLFVARGVRLWGTYDEQGRKVNLQEDQDAQQDGGEDLLDHAAVQTFLNGGKVFAVPQAEVPDGQAMAAIYRY
jgi:hypothetical protein